jgi:hypothetical protein
MLADSVRSFVNHGIIGVVFPVLALLAIGGMIVTAVTGYAIGCLTIVMLERWSGERLRRYLIATGQPLPDWLQRPYLMTSRVVIKRV